MSNLLQLAGKYGLPHFVKRLFCLRLTEKHAADKFQKRRLSGPAHADKEKHLTRFNSQRNIGQGRDVRRIILADLDQFDNGRLRG